MPEKMIHHQVLDAKYIKKERMYILLMFVGIFLIGMISIGLIAYVSFVGMSSQKPAKVLKR